MLPYMAQTCPQLPYMALTCPQNILSKPLCHKIPPARNDLNRSRGTEPRQLIGLTSDNAHFDPTLLLIVTRNTCMQQPLAYIFQTLFQHEVFVISPTLNAGSRCHVILVMATR
jgi:hypothetical protein